MEVHIRRVALLLLAVLVGATPHLVAAVSTRKAVRIPDIVRVSVAHAVPLQRVTAYNAVPDQTDDDPNLSSCGPTVAGQIAVSQDLLFEGGHKVLCGRLATIVLTTTSGYKVVRGVINDTMNRRYRASADILLPSGGEAASFGVKQGWLILD